MIKYICLTLSIHQIRLVMAPRMASNWWCPANKQVFYSEQPTLEYTAIFLATVSHLGVTGKPDSLQRRTAATHHRNPLKWKTRECRTDLLPSCQANNLRGMLKCEDSNIFVWGLLVAVPRVPVL